MACLPCPASYSTSFDQLFLRVLTPGWHAMCRIVERVPWFGLDLQFWFFSIFWFLILICVLAPVSHAMCQIIEHIPWVLTKLDMPLLHIHWTAHFCEDPFYHLLTIHLRRCHSERVPFWEGAILRECHSPARTLADGAVITAPLNHLTLAVMAARESEEKPKCLFTLSATESTRTPSQMQEFHPWRVRCGWGVRNVGVLKAGLLKNGFECKSTLLRFAKGWSQAKVVSFSFIENYR